MIEAWLDDLRGIIEVEECEVVESVGYSCVDAWDVVADVRPYGASHLSPGGEVVV